MNQSKLEAVRQMHTALDETYGICTSGTLISILICFCCCFPISKNYFRDNWNVFDFIIVLGSLLDFALGMIQVRRWKDPRIGVRDLVRIRLFKPSAYALDCHISHQFRTNSLLFNWSATGRSEGYGNVTGLTFESRTRSRTRTPI